MMMRAAFGRMLMSLANAGAERHGRARRDRDDKDCVMK
jgi:hypothetical protein